MPAFPSVRRSLVVLLLSLLLLSPLFAIPPSFVDDREGWLDFNLLFSWGLGDTMPTFGFEMSGCGPERLGLGFGFRFGQDALVLYMDGIYFWDPAALAFFTVPFKLRLGACLGPGDSAGFAASLLGGCKIFPLLLRYDEEEIEDLGADVAAYAAVNWWNGRFFPSLDAEIGIAIGLAPDEYTYIYY